MTMILHYEEYAFDNVDIALIKKQIMMILYVCNTKCMTCGLHISKDVVKAHNHDNDSYSNTNKYDNDDIVCLDHEMLGSGAS